MSILRGPELSDLEGIGDLTLGGFLEEVCARFADHEALVFDDALRSGVTIRWSYADLRREARRIAAGLIGSGTAKGSRVGILMGNRPEAVASFFGAAMAGAVVVPLSTFSARPEIAFLLEDAAVDTLLTQTSMRGRRFTDDVGALCPQLPCPDLPYLRLVAAVALDRDTGPACSWERLLAAGERVSPKVIDARIRHARPSDEGMIIYSSGTTDRPKGVRHCHRAATLQFWLQARIFGRTEQTRLWTSLPMFWTAGINTAMGPTLAAGGCWVMQEHFEAAPALALMERERVTEPYSLPHQTAALEEDPNWATTDLSSLRSVYGKSSFARHPTVQGDTGWNMPVAYGSSETCTGFASHYCDTPRELLKTSTGRLLPGNRLKVIDPDSGATLGSDEVGELVISGPTLMLGYVGRDRGDCFDEEGFFHTGDIGFFDREGYVHWVGRRSEMIKTGGASVSPAEIEVALRAFAPLKLARVIGVSDDRLGQVAVLCAVLKDGAETDADQIRQFLRGRLAGYKIPRHILFFEDGEIPMTQSDTKTRDMELIDLVRSRLTTSGADD